MDNNIISIASENEFDQINLAAKAASRLILESGIVLFPTDTTYALGVNAVDELAIEKLYNLKLRPPQKPIHVIVSNLEMARKYVHLNDIAYKLAEKFLPGPLTLILKHKNNIPRNLVAGFPTLGIRIPGKKISLELARIADLPITATSANISGQTEVYAINDFVKQINSFNPDGAVDLIIDQGILPVVKPSTIIDLTQETPVVLREGPISAIEIKEYLYGK